MAVRAYRGVFRRHTLPDPGLFDETIVLVPTIKTDGTRDPNVTVYGRIEAVEAGSRDYTIVEEYVRVHADNRGGTATETFDVTDVNYFRKVTFVFRGFDPYKYQMVYLPTFIWNFNWDVISHEQPLGPGTDYHTVYLTMSFEDPENAIDAWPGGDVQENPIAVQPLVPGGSAVLPTDPGAVVTQPMDPVVVVDSPPANPPAGTITVPADPVAPGAEVPVEPITSPGVPTEPPALPTAPPANPVAPGAPVVPTNPTSPLPGNAVIRPSWANAIGANLPGAPLATTARIFTFNMTIVDLPAYEDDTYVRGNKWISGVFAYYDYNPAIAPPHVPILPDQNLVFFYHELLTKPHWVGYANVQTLRDTSRFVFSRTPWNNGSHDVRVAVRAYATLPQNPGTIASPVIDQAAINNVQELVEVMRIYNPGSLWTRTTSHFLFEQNPFGSFEHPDDFEAPPAGQAGWSVYTRNNSATPSVPLSPTTIALPSGIKQPGLSHGAQYAEAYNGWVVRRATQSTGPVYDWQGSHGEGTEAHWTYYNYDPYINPHASSTSFETVGGVNYSYNTDDTRPYWICSVPQNQYAQVPHRGTLGVNAFNFDQAVWFLFDPQHPLDNQPTHSVELFPPIDRQLRLPSEDALTQFYLYPQVANVQGLDIDDRADVQARVSAGWAFYSAPRSPIAGVAHSWRATIPQTDILATQAQQLVEIMQTYHPGSRMTPHANTYYYEYNPIGNFGTVDQLPVDGGHPPVPPPVETEEPLGTGFYHEIFHNLLGEEIDFQNAGVNYTPTSLRDRFIAGTGPGAALEWAPHGGVVPGVEPGGGFRYILKMDNNALGFGYPPDRYISIMRTYHPFSNYHYVPPTSFESGNGFSYFEFNPFGNFTHPTDLLGIPDEELVLDAIQPDEQEQPGPSEPIGPVPEPQAPPPTHGFYADYFGDSGLLNGIVTPEQLRTGFVQSSGGVAVSVGSFGTIRFWESPQSLDGTPYTLRFDSSTNVGEVKNIYMQYHPAGQLVDLGNAVYFEFNPFGNFTSNTQIAGNPADNLVLAAN